MCIRDRRHRAVGAADDERGTCRDVRRNRVLRNRNQGRERSGGRIVPLERAEDAARARHIRGNGSVTACSRASKTRGLERSELCVRAKTPARRRCGSLNGKRVCFFVTCRSRRTSVWPSIQRGRRRRARIGRWRARIGAGRRRRGRGIRGHRCIGPRPAVPQRRGRGDRRGASANGRAGCHQYEEGTNRSIRLHGRLSLLSSQSVRRRDPRATNAPEPIWREMWPSVGQSTRGVNESSHRGRRQRSPHEEEQNVRDEMAAVRSTERRDESLSPVFNGIAGLLLSIFLS